jgi:hypothetical protein
MRPTRFPSSTAAFTRADLIVLLVALAILAGVGVQALAGARPRSLMAECVNNLRRVGQGFHVWASDHGDQFPWTVPLSEGTRTSPLVNQHFAVASNEFVTPNFLACPSDAARVRARDWTVFLSSGNNYLSYFAGLHASLNQPRVWLSGDRNLSGLESQACSVTQISPCTTVSPASASAWGRDLHAGAGNLLIGDGRVWQVSNRELSNFVERATSQDPQGFLDLLKPWP